MGIPAEQCAALLRDALSNRPTDPWSDSAAAWFSDVAGIIIAHDAGIGLPFQLLIPRVTGISSAATSPTLSTMVLNAQSEFVARARSVLTLLQLTTNTYTTRSLGQGAVYDYFEEVRRLLTGAQQDLLFIDPYIDPSFIARYVPQIASGVSIRLLTAEPRAAQLIPALALYEQQHQITIQARFVPEKSLHDRHLVVDHRDVYQSGASFKDGGRNAPTSINQIVDVATDMIRAHEDRWANARVPN